VLLGLFAGAIGTVALNLVTYIDMALRGRPPSELPSKVVQALAAHLGLTDLAKPDEQSDDKLEQQRSAIGALLGFGVGLGVGAAYGIARPLARSVPWPMAGIMLGAAAMAASDVPATQLGLTNPAEWSEADWLSDVIPHLAYGVFTAFSYQRFAGSK
jgi:hypothetical protein